MRYYWEWELNNGVLTISGTGPMSGIYGDDSIPWLDSMDSIRKVVVKPGITTIADFVFQDCVNLEEIEIPEGITSIGAFAFTDSGVKKLHLPASLESVDMFTFSGCENLTEITVAKGNRFFASQDGALYTKDMKALIQYPIGKTDDLFIVPNGVETLYAGSLALSRYLLTLKLPVSLKRIEMAAIGSMPKLTTVIYAGTKDQWKQIINGGANSSLDTVTILYGG